MEEKTASKTRDKVQVGLSTDYGDKQSERLQVLVAELLIKNQLLRAKLKEQIDNSVIGL